MAVAQESARFKVHAARTDEEKLRVYRFRYETLIEEMGGESVQAESTSKTIKDDLDEHAIQLYLTADDRIAIAVQVYATDRKGVPETMAKHFDLDSFEEFTGTVFSFTSWLTVAKDWHGSTRSPRRCWAPPTRSRAARAAASTSAPARPRACRCTSASAIVSSWRTSSMRTRATRCRWCC